MCVCTLSHSVMSDSWWPPWTIACQAPLFIGLSRQEYWNGLPCPSPGDLPNLGIEPRSPISQAESLPSEPPGKPPFPTVILNWYPICIIKPKGLCFSKLFPSSHKWLFLFSTMKRKNRCFSPLSLLTWKNNMCQSRKFQEKYGHTGKGSHLISSNALLGEACGNAQDSLFIISCTAVFPNLREPTTLNWTWSWWSQTALVSRDPDLKRLFCPEEGKKTIKITFPPSQQALCYYNLFWLGGGISLTCYHQDWPQACYI